MPAETPLQPATAADVAEALSFALRYNGRKRVHHADEMMARITAERLVEHLTRSGFVLMKTPPGQLHSAPPVKPTEPNDE
jgi:hypothetical protein